MSRTVMESRAMDAHYDTVYLTPARNNSAFVPMRPAVLADGGNPTVGPNQQKYLKRPLIPLLDAAPPGVVLAPAVVNDPAQAVDLEPDPFQKDASTQTRYRESEAQTEPYEPKYATDQSGELPEVLMLRGLVAGKGLPVGPREIAMLEAARQKRALEAALPPFTDEASLKLRTRLMQAQELRELRAREAELDRARDERLRLLRRALDERDRGDEFLAEQRIEALRHARAEHKERRLAHIQRERLKVLRKLTKARRAMPVPGAGVGNLSSGSAGSRRGRRDILAEYADFGSEVYAPTRRLGRRVDKDSARFDSSTRTIPPTSYAALLDLEAELPSNLTTHGTAAKPPLPGPLLDGGREGGGGNSSKVRKAVAASAHLEYMAELLLARAEEAAARGTAGAAAPSGSAPGTADRPADGAAAALAARKGGEDAAAAEAMPQEAGADGGGAAPAKRARNARKERPATPDSALVTEVADEERYQALLLLQRLLRGRAAQNAMFEAKEQRAELVRELRLAARADTDPAAVAASQRASEEARMAEVQEAALDAMAGEVFTAVLAAMAGLPPPPPAGVDELDGNGFAEPRAAASVAADGATSHEGGVAAPEGVHEAEPDGGAIVGGSAEAAAPEGAATDGDADGAVAGGLAARNVAESIAEVARREVEGIVGPVVTRLSMIMKGPKL